MKIYYRSIFLIVTLAVLALASCEDPEICSGTDAPGLMSKGVTTFGYQVITEETDLNSSITKQLQAACPEGMKVLGAGWAVLDSTNVILDGKVTFFAPKFDGSGWMANAELRNQRNREWKLRLSILCVPESSLSGYQIVIAETSVSNLGIKNLSVDCPDGKKAVGAGWGALDSTNAILPGEASCFIPKYDGSGWLTKAVCSATWTDWKLRSYLICADSESLPNYQIITAETALSDQRIKQLSVSCPSDGKALCAGWSVLDSTSAILPGAELYSMPAYDGSRWLTNAMNYATWPSGEIWKLRVRLICF